MKNMDSLFLIKNAQEISDTDVLQSGFKFLRIASLGYAVISLFMPAPGAEYSLLGLKYSNEFLGTLPKNDKYSSLEELKFCGTQSEDKVLKFIESKLS